MIPDNTAGIFTRKIRYNRHEMSTYLLPVVISDNDYPIQSSTETVTIRVCACDHRGKMLSCNAEALIHPTGLSTGALIAILLCIIILLGKWLRGILFFTWLNWFWACQTYTHTKPNKKPHQTTWKVSLLNTFRTIKKFKRLTSKEMGQGGKTFRSKRSVSQMSVAYFLLLQVVIPRLEKEQSRSIHVLSDIYIIVFPPLRDTGDMVYGIHPT